MPNWKIRPAQARDAEPLANCIDSAYAVYKDRIADLPAVSEGLADDIGSHLVWVAESEQSIIGGLILIPRNEFALLANVAVDPMFSGQGLGRRLIERAEQECRRLGLRELRLATHVAMPETVRLYEHLGWKETARAGNKVQMVKRV